MEDKMKYFIPMIILSLVLLSCSKDEDEETQTAAEKAAAAQLVALEGTWKTACYTNSDNTSTSNIDTLTFVGNVLTIKEEKHSDTSCATDYRLREEAHTFSVGDAGKVLIRIGTTKRTPQSSAAVSAYNTANKCSYNEWELDTVKDCTEAEDNQGDSVYCLYELSGTTLYVKCDGDEQPTSITKDNESTFTKQ